MASTNEQKPITKKELEMTKQELLGRLASKEDLKQFATKEDLKQFATKEDLKRFATKKDFEIIASQVVNLTHRMTSVESQLSVVQDTSNLILETVDGIAKKFDDAQTEKAATNHTLRRQENRL
ncbi:hypothetical protein IH824_06490 [candidate division KSB1 bacterium]|nr:hypothetical protein [candidate division KSB1 bacterium]